MPATYDDANLMVQLLRWGADLHLEEAVSAVMSDGFDPTKATPDEPPVRSLLTFGETIGTFVKQGVLDLGLVLDLLWVDGIWAKVAPAALKARQRADEPRLYENFEALAKAAKAI
jgi:hypothetical protein